MILYEAHFISLRKIFYWCDKKAQLCKNKNRSAQYFKKNLSHIEKSISQQIKK